MGDTLRTRCEVGSATLLAILLVLGASTARSQPTAADDAGVCGRCHTIQAGIAASTGGHAAVLGCGSCHADRRPGRVGRRHRAVADCGDCHEMPGHPARKRSGARRITRNCLACHDPHGSSNLQLVTTGVFWRRRVLDVLFTTEDGAAPGGFTHPDAPGTGLCEVCHRGTDFYRRNGKGEPHFTQTCTLCHPHDAAFGVSVSDQSCPICHADEAARLAEPSGHQPLPCVECHAEVSPVPGPGHRAAEACEACHAGTATHAPAGNAIPCAQCHDPHGSDNTQLVRDVLTTTLGTSVPILFDNLDGRADGSFASASAPGTGVCEVCHTTTRFYRADGTGDPHFTFSCLPCHRHGRGFQPQ